MFSWVAAGYVDLSDTITYGRPRTNFGQSKQEHGRWESSIRDRDTRRTIIYVLEVNRSTNAVNCAFWITMPSKTAFCQNNTGAHEETEILEYSLVSRVVDAIDTNRLVAAELELLDDVADLFKAMNIMVLPHCRFRDH